MSQLQRKLGLWTCVSIVVGAVIGSSIFMKPATMAAQLGSPLLLLLVWIVAGIISVFGGMINAEVGCVLPETGGQYIYFRHMYGNFFAFLFGWAGFIVINTASIAGIAFVFANYTEYFIALPRFPEEVEKSIQLYIPFIGRFNVLENMGVKSLAILLLFVFTFINVRSLKAAGATQVFFSIIKVAALIFLVMAIFLSGNGDLNNLQKASANFNYSFWPVLTAFMAATTGALAAYDGWNNLGFVAGEIKDPQKNIPRGLIIGLGTCILLYVLTTEAYLYILPVDVMKNSKLVASDAMMNVMGVGGGAFVAIIVMISTAGGVNGNILPCTRVTFAMSQEGNFFPFAGIVHKKYNTPSNALVFQATWAALLVLIGSFDMLMDLFVFVTWIFYGFAAYGIFILRKKMPEADRAYKMKGYPYLPIIFILFALMYVGITLYTDINNYLSGKTLFINSVFGLVLTAAGIPLYYYFKRNNRLGNKV
jgi:basic amino acid/polyamine antiporter, APA family